MKSRLKVSEVADIPGLIRELLESESFAVLATQGEGQPYASIIAFASSEDLKNIIFVTTKDTRKFSLLKESDKVAFLVDNRSHKSSLKRISAVTITGRAQIIKNDEMKWINLLYKKHPYLQEFIKAPSTALINVEVFRYFFVHKFQEVVEWIP